MTRVEIAYRLQREEKQKRENKYIYKYPINTFGSKGIKGIYRV